MAALSDLEQYEWDEQDARQTVRRISAHVLAGNSPTYAGPTKFDPSPADQRSYWRRHTWPMAVMVLGGYGIVVSCIVMAKALLGW